MTSQVVTTVLNEQDLISILENNFLEEDPIQQTSSFSVFRKDTEFGTQILIQSAASLSDNLLLEIEKIQ